MLRRPRLAACLAALFVLQACLAQRFSYSFLRVDLLLALAAFLSLEASHRGALGGAFAVGIIRDLGSSGRLGSSALLMLVAAAGTVTLGEYLLRESFWTELLLVALFILAFSVAESVLGMVCAGTASAPLLRAGLGQAAFTAAVTPLLLPVLHSMRIVERPGGFAAR